MSRRDFAWLKRQRLQWMLRVIENQERIPLKRFLAVCAYNLGLRYSTTKRYLRELMDLEVITIEDGQIVFLGDGRKLAQSGERYGELESP